MNFYTLDIGYSFIVEVARLAFPTLPDNHLRALALQLVSDLALVWFVFFLFSQWNLVLGFVAAYLYASNGIFYDLVSFAFYYYWDIPLTFVVLGSMLLAYRRPSEAGAWLACGGIALGCAVWLRGSWWPLSLFLCGVAAWEPSLRKRLWIPVVLFTIIAAPSVVRSTRARGQLTFTTRAVWHVALVGLGYYPNPYGLEAKDGTIFELTRQKYGVTFKSEDYWLHDQAAKKEFFSIWEKDKAFVIRSFFGRLEESILGTTQTSVLSFLFLSNLTYRMLCLVGFGAMVIRGGDRRMLGDRGGGHLCDLHRAHLCLLFRRTGVRECLRSHEVHTFSSVPSMPPGIWYSSRLPACWRAGGLSDPGRSRFDSRQQDGMCHGDIADVADREPQKCCSISV